MANNYPICFFDSGVGGLSVYARFKNILPFENTIYFGDTKNLPYGNKSKDELIGFAQNILKFFEAQKAKAVVIACNTSSALAYDAIKDDYDFPIYPIIQSCAKVIAANNYSKIGIFATQGTVNSKAYTKEIHKHNPNIIVHEIACPNWVNFVEAGNINSQNANKDIELHLKKMLEFAPDKIILGCTHYPYLLDTLKYFTKADNFLDPAEIFVDFIKNDLSQKQLLTSSNSIGNEKLYVSANPQEFTKNAKLFYNLKTLPLLY